MSGPAAGRVFISYRRQESSGMAGRLYDRLAARFGANQVFMDVDTIALGVDFAEVISQAVTTCAVLLAVIGPHWLSATDEDGQRRLDDPDDIVRLEIGAALERDVRVIPILVEGAVMPRAGELPESLAGLARRNAFSLRHESFRVDVDRLLAEIEPILPAADAASVASGPAPGVPVAVDRAPVALEPNAVLAVRHDEKVNGVALSPDGRLLATASADRTARVWEVPTGRERARITHDGPLYEVALSPDGRLLATASYDERAWMWEVLTGRERARITHSHWINGLAFSPDGRLLATASADRTARVWEVPTGRERARITHEGAVYKVALSPDGRLLATVTGRTAQVWEVDGGQARARVTHDGWIHAVAFSPGGWLLATASDDRTARVWEVPSGQERARVTHDGPVWGVTFSPDGWLLASAGADRTARVWEVPSGQERAWAGHDERVREVAFSPDGRLLTTASDDATARVWTLAR